MKNQFVLIIFFSLFINTSFSQFTNVMIDDNANPDEPSISINLLNTDLVAAGSNIENCYYSTDGGLTWFTDLITSTFTNLGDPCLISDSSGNFFFFHLVNQTDRIVCQKSTDGGVNYSNGSYAWNNNTHLQDKEWAVADPNTGNLFVTWTQYDLPGTGLQDSSRIFFSRSLNNGASFSTPIRLNEIAGDCWYLDITDAHPFVGINGEIYVTYMDSGGIHFNKSLDTGVTWMPSQPLIEAGGAYRYNSVPGVNRIRAMPYSCTDRSNSNYRGNLYVSWSDQRNGTNNSDVFFIRSTDGGNSWTPAMKVNSDSSGRHQYRNAMAVDQTNGNIYIVFHDRRNYANNDSIDIYLAKSTDGGSTWTDFKISNSGFYSDGTLFDGDYIDIAAHSGRIRPVWTRVDTFGPEVWTAIINEPPSGIQVPSSSSRDMSFTVNPNPANVAASISFSEEVKNLDVKIFDASGRVVSVFHLDNQREKTFAVTNLVSGIYFIQTGGLTRKLVVSR